MMHRVLYVAAVAALVAAGACVVLILEMYDLSPRNWGPSGVGFEEWHGAWKAQRDRYGLIGMCSVMTFVVLALAGLWIDLRPGRVARG